MPAFPCAAPFPKQRPDANRRRLPASVALAVGVAVALGARRTDAADAPRIAVMEFTAAASDPSLAPLGKGLQSMLTTDLAQVASIQLVERSRLHEIQAELQLQAGGAVDPATAVRVGKLAGASHLVAGSFTVLGPSMRLDARMFAVQDGSVLVAQSVEGSTEAFFELEKQLVQAFLPALGLSLQPKERAAVARIHTADYEAFKDFSRGIDLFDQRAWDDAVARLRAAAERDADFKLARVTLEEYERIIESLRSRGEAIETAKAELERLERQKEVSDEAAVVARLLQIAAQKGDAARRERLTAMYLLVVAYANLGSNQGKLHRLRATEDRFAMRRAAEALARAYYAEALPLWPALPLLISDRFWSDLPTPADFDAGFADAVAELWEWGSDYPENRRNAFLQDMRYPAETARLLRLDREGELRLLETMWNRGQVLQPDEGWRKEMREGLLRLYRQTLRLDEATALLTRQASGSGNEWELKSLADEIALHRDIETALAGAADRRLAREWFVLGQDDWSWQPLLRFASEQLAHGADPREVRDQLNRFRDIPREGYLLLDGAPAFVLQGDWYLRSGPRSDFLAAHSLRWYREPDREALDGLVVLDGAPRADVGVSFVLDFDPAEDAWPSGLQADDVPPGGRPPWAAGRPPVTFLFAMRDVDCALQEDAAGDRVLARPLRALGLRFDGDVVRLVEVTESERGHYDRKHAFTVETRGEARLLSVGKAARIPIDVRIRGAQVSGSAAGKPFAFRIDGDAVGRGFFGFWFGGAGYVEIGDVKLDVLAE